jgi:hypothetical protein
MISCTTFRETFAPATENAELLEHLRNCDLCLEHAASIDPDALFRAIGGGELVPVGGLDLFVEEVMQQVRVRETEHALGPQRLPSWTGRLAIAASLAMAVVAGSTFYANRPAAHSQMASLPAAHRALPATQLTTKPIVDTYDSASATIVEVPSEGANDVKVVMVFDETLPADL